MKTPLTSSPQGKRVLSTFFFTSHSQSRCKVFLSILTLAMLFVAMDAYCQAQPLDPLPPTPNVGALTKYIDFPTGTYTGIPQINLPLTEVTSGDLKVPISLSYHALGVNISEEASWVGLNWNLDAFFVVTQQVRGKNDYAYSGYFSGWQPMIDLLCGASSGATGYRFRPMVSSGSNGFCHGNVMIGDMSWIFSRNPTVNGVVESDGTKYCNDYFDWEPDIFTFSTPSGSGKFVFDQNHNLYQLDQQDFVITENGGWTVTTSDGIEYTFGKVENEWNLGTVVSTSWYLTKITSPRGQRTIELEYEDGPVTALTHKENSYSGTYSLLGSNGGPLGTGSNSRTNQRSYTPVYLKKISFDGGRIEFIRDTNPREDLQGEYALKFIRQYNINGELTREFELLQSHFVGQQTAKDPLITYSNNAERDYDLKRLKLTGLVERSPDGSESLTTSFTYDESKPLPQKSSFAKDLWGFYNGKSSNSTPLPSFKTMVYDISSQIPGAKYFDFLGADRSASITYARAGMLTSITYPTGGSTNFEYELNDYRNTKEYISHSYDTYKKVQSAPYNVDASSAITTTIDSEEKNTAKLKITGFCQNCNGLPAGSYVRINKNGTMVKSLELSTLIYNFPNSTTESNSGGYYNLNFNESLGQLITDPTGTLEVYIVSPNTNDYLIQATLVKQSLEKQFKKSGGGLRLRKKKETSETGESNVNVLLYGTSATSWGKIIRQPLFYDIYISQPGYDNVGNPIEGWLKSFRVSSGPVTSPAGANGGLVGYDKVVILKGENGENGKIENHYYNTADSSFVNEFRPNSLPAVANPFNGKVKSNSIFDNGGKLIQIDSNTYVTGLSIIVKAMSHMVYDGYQSACGIDSGTGYQYLVYYYPIYSTWTRLQSSYHATYNSNGQSINVSKQFAYQPITGWPESGFIFNASGIYKLSTDFSYSDLPKHYSPIKETTVDSKSLVHEVRYKYAEDYSSPSLELQKVIEKNLDSNPVERATWVDGQLLGLEATKFLYDASLNSVNVSSILNLEVDKGITDYIASSDGSTFDSRLKVKYLNYGFDQKGQVLENGLSNNIHIVYLYGYNESLPIAKIENATYAEVTSALGATNLTLIKGNTLNDDQLRTIFGNLRTALPKALITSITYRQGYGVSSITDPNNNPAYYDYDGLGRLIVIKDADQNIVKTYSYHYKQ